MFNLSLNSLEKDKRKTVVHAVKSLFRITEMT